MTRADRDYEKWHKIKASINLRQASSLGYKERDIWWVYLGQNVGDEEDGKGEYFSRPVLVLKGFSSHLLWGIPLSTTSRRGKYYHSFEFNGKTSVALLSQMRTIDTNRLISKVGMIGPDDYTEIKGAIMKLIVV